MTPFSGDNAKSIYIGYMHFMLDDDGRLWSMCDHKWRTHGATAWCEARSDRHFVLGIDTPFEISLNGNPADDIYLVTKDGYEKVEPGPSLCEMIEKIVKRVKIIERRGNTVYALLEGREVAVGCIDTITLLDAQFMIKTIHERDERSLYKVVMPKTLNTKPFEKHRGLIVNLYERICK